jgi:hypothetical protein
MFLSGKHIFCSLLALPLCVCAGAFIKGSPVLSWAASNTRKMKLEHTPGSLDCCKLFRIRPQCSRLGCNSS